MVLLLGSAFKLFADFALLLQASLAINPTALLPGASPPVKEEKPVAVGFDQPVEAATLHTAQKVGYVADLSSLQTKFFRTLLFCFSEKLSK